MITLLPQLPDGCNFSGSPHLTCVILVCDEKDGFMRMGSASDGSGERRMDRQGYGLPFASAPAVYCTVSTE